MPPGELEQIEIPDLGDLNLMSGPETPAGPAPEGERFSFPELEPAVANTEEDEKPIAEYALHILFTRFVRYTEKKLSMLPQTPDESIEDLLGEGVDAEFDLILESMGHVARRRPKPVIDSIMYWRKTKRGQPSISLASLYVLCRALMEVIRQTPPEILGESLGEKLEDIVFKQMISADPEVVASNGVRGANWRYLAKLLGEMSSFRLASVDDRFLAELEKKVTSKKQEVRAALLLEAMQHLKIKLYPEEFLEESSVFLESLSKFYLRTPASSPLRVKYATAISHMLEPLAESVTVEVNQPVWARTMETLYQASQEKHTNTGIASRAASVGSASSQTANSPTFALSVMSLCLSPQSFFSEHWLSLLESYVQKNKAKPQRIIQLMPSAARLAWVYMFRCGESLNVTTKKIEALRKLFLSNTTRKYWQAVNADREARAACISLLRSAFQGYQQYTLDELLFPMLVGGDSTTVSQQQSIAFDSAVLPERAGIAVDAFTVVMKDLRTGNRPPFPVVRNISSLQASPSANEPLAGAREAKDTELPHRPIITAAMQASIDLFGSCIGQIGAWIEQGGVISDQASRQNSVSHLVSLASGGMSSSLQVADMAAERMFIGVKSAEQHLLLIFLRSWPSWWSPEQHLRHLDVLCRCVGHPVSILSEASAESLIKIAAECDMRTLFTPYTKAMMAVDAKNAEAMDVIGAQGTGASISGPTYDGNSSGAHGHSSSFSFGSGLRTSGLGLGLHMGSNSNDYDVSHDVASDTLAQSPGHIVAKHLGLYVKLVELWVSRLQNGDAAIPGPSVNSQMLVLWSAVEEIEGNGLFFLCSQDMAVRALGLRILWLTTTMDQAIMNYQESAQSTSGDTKPSRIINLLQATPIVQILSQAWKRIELSMPERNRLAKFRSKRASLARLAESTYGVDSALWLKFFPTIISLCFETHPIPVALCRNLVCDRLVQMHEAVSEIASRQETNVSMPTAFGIIEQWKVYLIVACATLTSTEEQKLHVPTQTNSLAGLSAMHTRKRSHQRITLHHQRITSARSVFKIVIPMLGSEKNSVRDAIVSGLSCTNVNTYKTLLECLQPVLSEALPRFEHLQRQQVKTNITNDSLLRVITGIAQILKQTTVFLELRDIRQDVWIRTEVVSVLQQLREMLGQVQSSQGTSLRIAFSELLTDTYTALGPSLMFTGRNPAAEWLLFWKTVDIWSPYGSNSSAVLEKRANVRRSAQSDVMLAQFEIVKRDTDRATSRAMAALLKESQGFINDLQPVLHWIYALLASNSDQISQDTGRTALENLLVSYASRPELLLEVVTRCYHNSSERSRGVAKVYFVALVNILEAHPELLEQKMEKPQQFLALALFKIGDPDSQTRFRAVKLIEVVEQALYGESVIAGEFQFRLRSTSPSVYKREIFVLSGKLAAKRSHESFYLFSQMTRAFQAVNDSDRRDILSVVLPWIQNIEFSSENDSDLQMVLANLLEITAVFSGRMQHEVEALWVALCTSGTGATNNAIRVLDFLLNFCLQQRTAGSVSVSRTALIYLLSSPATGVITEKLLSYLEPAHMITQSNDNTELVSPSCEEEFPYVASLANVVALANELESGSKSAVPLPPFSHGQLAVVFLVDTISASTPVAPKLASLLHICVVLGDHFVSLVQDKTRELLLNLAGMFNPEPESMQKLTNLLSNLRWRYGDESGAVPDQMGELVSALLAHINGHDALDPSEWSQVALKWATASPVRHIACRSLQVYRCLDLHLDVKILGNLLARLSSTISEQAADIQGFATQILMTLNSIVDQLDAEQLLVYPQLYWATIASLTTANEREYIEAMSILGKLLSKWTPAHAEAALKTFPPRWEGSLDDFGGVLPLALHGLRSQNTIDLSYEVLDQLTELKTRQLTEQENILLFGTSRDPSPKLLAASLPRFLTAMDQPHLVTGLATTAQLLHRLAAPFSGGLSRTLDSFVKRRFWSRADFLRQYVLALPAAFPDYNVDLVIFFLEMVNNSAAPVRQAALDILKTLIPEVQIHGIDAEKWRGADLVAPLLRLLTTPDVEESLSVLDLVASVRPDPLDRDVLRMTLGSRQLFREYEYTETLFGIPDEWGWSVPMPAQASIVTRQNVHAVFYTCSPNHAALGDEDFQAPEAGVELFERDEYTFEQNLYRHQSVHGSSHNVGTESMDKILTDLDEFDSFFTRVGGPRQSQRRMSDRHESDRKSPSSPPNRTTNVNSPRGRLFGNAAGGAGTSDVPASPISPIAHTPSESESIPQLYDKKVSLILNRSLARSPSQFSFKTSFADSFGRSQQQLPVSQKVQQPGTSRMVPTQAHERLPSTQSAGFPNYSFADNASITSLSASQRRVSTDSTATVADSQDSDQSPHAQAAASFRDGPAGFPGVSGENTFPSRWHSFSMTEDELTGSDIEQRALGNASVHENSEMNPKKGFNFSNAQPVVHQEQQVQTHQQVHQVAPQPPPQFRHEYQRREQQQRQKQQQQQQQQQQQEQQQQQLLQKHQEVQQQASYEDSLAAFGIPDSDKGTRRPPDSSFRLESLLRGKRRSKSEKSKDKTKSRFAKDSSSKDRTPEAFKFPPRQ